MTKEKQIREINNRIERLNWEVRFLDGLKFIINYDNENFDKFKEWLYDRGIKQNDYSFTWYDNEQATTWENIIINNWEEFVNEQ